MLAVGAVEVVWTSLIYHFPFLPLSVWVPARYRLKYCLKGPLSLKQPTNQTLLKLRAHNSAYIKTAGHKPPMQRLIRYYMYTLKCNIVAQTIRILKTLVFAIWYLFKYKIIKYDGIKNISCKKREN